MLKYLFAFLLISCTTKQVKTNRELFDDFHTCFQQRDFDKLDLLLADNFSFTSNGQPSGSKISYLQYLMEWNTVLNTKWNVVTVTESKDDIQSIEYDTDSFNDFFYPDKLKYKYTYYFSNGKISRINSEDLPDSAAAKEAFHEKFTAFYKWVSETEPFNTKYLTTSDRHSAEVVKTMLTKYILFLKK